MKILVVSGFLGAGKTTFIKALAENTKKQFVVLENEFAEVSVDGPLLADIMTDSAMVPLTLEQAAAEEASLPEDARVWELTEGCICCSLSLSFSTSVLTIANTLNPDILVIEPSGVALLQAVTEQLSRICYEKIGLLETITLVDFQHYRENRRDFPACISDQIQGGGWILFSKSEQSDSEEMAGLAEEMKAENPSATVIPGHYSDFDEARWESFLAREKGESVEATAQRLKEEPQMTIGSLSLVEPVMESIPQLMGALQVLVSGCVGNIVRAKGFLPIGDEWIRFDLVSGKYEITGTTVQEGARIVVIGERLKRNAIKKLFGAIVYVKPESEEAFMNDVKTNLL